MAKCPFCSSDSELDKVRIKTDGDWWIWLDQKPIAKGHVLVVPVKHFSLLNGMSQDQRNKLFQLGVQIGERMRGALGAKAYILKLNNGLFQIDSDPNHVGHIHLHIVPRYKKDEERFETNEEYFVGYKKMLVLLAQVNG